MGFLLPRNAETCKVVSFRAPIILLPVKLLRTLNLSCSVRSAFVLTDVVRAYGRSRSCGAAGYRSSVLYIYVAASPVDATGCHHLLLPFVPIRSLHRDSSPAGLIRCCDCPVTCSM
nr:unnamed protein product [Digitaria exilis]